VSAHLWWVWNKPLIDYQALVARLSVKMTSIVDFIPKSVEVVEQEALPFGFEIAPNVGDKRRRETNDDKQREDALKRRIIWVSRAFSNVGGVIPIFNILHLFMKSAAAVGFTYATITVISQADASRWSFSLRMVTSEKISILLIGMLKANPTISLLLARFP
jgi:hypothetical protein